MCCQIHHGLRLVHLDLLYCVKIRSPGKSKSVCFTFSRVLASCLFLVTHTKLFLVPTVAINVQARLEKKEELHCKWASNPERPKSVYDLNFCSLFYHSLLISSAYLSHFLHTTSFIMSVCTQCLLSLKRRWLFY